MSMPVTVSNNELSATQSHGQSATFRWKVHLFRSQPQKGISALFAAALVAFLGYTALGSVLIAICAALAVILSISEFLFPIIYRMNERDASASSPFTTTSIRWEDVRHVCVDSNGVKLSPLARPSRLEPFRGIYLRFAGNRDQVLAEIEKHRKSSSD
jgi:hypothetical protein